MQQNALDTLLAREPSGRRISGATLAELNAIIPVNGDPATPTELLDLLRALYRIARRDLPLARLFEGNVDALQIIGRYAGDDTKKDVRQIVAAGGAFGVWNAALPSEPLRIEDGELLGGKSFASGAGVLSHALAGVDTPDGNRLILIDLAASAPLIDRDWWTVVGMQRSETHVVRWERAPRDSYRFVGRPGDYAREPFFSGGALRFVACHAGGVAALFDHVREHLVSTDRAHGPHQATRLAALYIAASSAASAVREAAAQWGQPAFVDHVAAARIAVTASAEEAMTVSQAAIGVSGSFVSHPLAAVFTDLTVYLRQPAPDAQRMRVGLAAADGALAPDL